MSKILFFKPSAACVIFLNYILDKLTQLWKSEKRCRQYSYNINKGLLLDAGRTYTWPGTEGTGGILSVVSYTYIMLPNGVRTGCRSDCHIIRLKLTAYYKCIWMVGGTCRK